MPNVLLAVRARIRKGKAIACNEEEEDKNDDKRKGNSDAGVSKGKSLRDVRPVCVRARHDRTSSSIEGLHARHKWLFG